MANINTYAVVNKCAWSAPSQVQLYRTIELRETASYLIDDKTGKRYKKVWDSEHVAVLVHSSSHRYSRSVDHVYELGSSFIAETDEANRKIKFYYNVCNALRALTPNNYDEAVKVAEMIGYKE